MKHSRTVVLGVPFDSVTLQEAVQKLEAACKTESQLRVVTPNPEICLLAQGDSDYARMLRSADLSIPDGFGILWASRYQNGPRSLRHWASSLLSPWQTRSSSPLPERVSGTDVMQRFMEAHPHRTVFLLGASEDVNQRLRDVLVAREINIVGSLSGSAGDEEADEICDRIRSSGAEVLFVAFGAPKQERWIFRHLFQLPRVRVAMGVGGAFDFLTEETKRAPKWMRNFGLEWMYRCSREPSRWRRILNATVVFSWKVFRDRATLHET